MASTLDTATNLGIEFALAEYESGVENPSPQDEEGFSDSGPNMYMTFRNVMDRDYNPDEHPEDAEDILKLARAWETGYQDEWRIIRTSHEAG